MLVPDVNLLIYAVDRQCRWHKQAKAWWEHVLSDVEPVGLTYPAMLGFVRITTHARVFQNPLTVDEALGYVHGWLEQPPVRLLTASAGHWQRVSTLLSNLGVAGPLTTDAHLAAYALEHAATLCSADADFRRFPELRLHNPLAT